MVSSFLHSEYFKKVCKRVEAIEKQLKFAFTLLNRDTFWVYSKRNLYISKCCILNNYSKKSECQKQTNNRDEYPGARARLFSIGIVHNIHRSFDICEVIVQISDILVDKVGNPSKVIFTSAIPCTSYSKSYIKVVVSNDCDHNGFVGWVRTAELEVTHVVDILAT